MEQLRQLVVALVGREEVGCAIIMSLIRGGDGTAEAARCGIGGKGRGGLCHNYVFDQRWRWNS